MLTAPVRVPVELRGASRFWRMAHAVAPEGIELGSDAPEELDGPVEIAFHLPGDSQAVRCKARVRERAVRFLDVDGDDRARIERYVKERLGIDV